MKVCWIDTETSGLDPFKDGIIQLAFIIDIDGEVKEKGTLYSNCEGKNINQKALDCNGFTLEKIKTFSPPKEMYKSLKQVLSKYVDPYNKNKEGRFYFAAYNATFDFGFISQLWKDQNDPYLFSFFNFGFVDPSSFVRFLQYSGVSFPAALRLDDLANALGVVPQGRLHDALTDITLTRDCTLEMARKYTAGPRRENMPKNIHENAPRMDEVPF